MFFSPRAGLRELANLCRRLAMALESGLDVRRVFERESRSAGSAALGRHLAEIRDQLARGVGLNDAVRSTGAYFPPLFREMIEVGEATGQTAEVLRQLASHYEHQLQLRRTFLAALAWPAMQLTAAVLIVGIMIWVLGMIGSASGTEPVDMLGLGLVGNRGVAIYFASVGAIVLGCVLLYQAARRNAVWVYPVQRVALAVPVLGANLRTLALARLAWSLQLTLDTGMPLERALPLSLRSTRNVLYSGQGDEVARAVRRGREISEALADAGGYPSEFLEHLEVGERSGRLPESMALLSEQYQDQAQRALSALTVLAGFAVWGLVALMIIAVIVRLFMFYVGTINDALNF